MLRRLALAWVLVGTLGVLAEAQIRSGPCVSCGQPACVSHVGPGPAAGFGGVGGGGVSGIGFGSTRPKEAGRGPMDLVPTRTALGRLGLERAWFGYVPLGPAERLIQVSMAEDLIFAQSNRATLHALDAESGQLVWSASLGAINAQAKPVSVNTSSVFATNANSLLQLDRGTGRLVREYKLEAFATSPTAANDDYVVVGLETGKLVGYNVRDRSDGTGPFQSAGSFAFAWKTANRLTSRPLVTPVVTAFGSQDNRLFVTTNRPPEVLYRFVTAGPIVAGIAPYGSRTVLVPSTDNTLYAVDLFDPRDPNQIHWEFPTGSPIEQQPLVAADAIYAMNAAGILFSIEGQTGIQNWSRPTNGGRFLSLSSKRIYLLSPEGDLAIVDRATGDILASPRATRERAGLGLRNYDLHITNADNDRIYLASPDGQLVAFREIGLVQPQVLRVGQETFGQAPVEVQQLTPEGDINPDAAGAEGLPMGNP